MRAKIFYTIGTVFFLILVATIVYINMNSNDYMSYVLNHFTELTDTSEQEYVTAREYQRVKNTLYYIDNEWNLKHKENKENTLVLRDVYSFLVRGMCMYYTNSNGYFSVYDLNGGEEAENIKISCNDVKILGIVDEFIYLLDFDNDALYCFDMKDWKEQFRYSLAEIYKKQRVIISQCLTKEHIVFLGDDGSLWDYDLNENHLKQMEIPIDMIEGVTQACIDESNGEVYYCCYKSASEDLPSRYAKNKQSDENGVYQYDSQMML